MRNKIKLSILTLFCVFDIPCEVVIKLQDCLEIDYQFNTEIT